MEENKTLSKLRAKINCAGNELRGRPYVKGFRVPRLSKCAASSSVRDASKQARIDEGRQRLRWHRFQKWFDSAAEGEAPDTCFDTPFGSPPYLPVGFPVSKSSALPFFVSSSTQGRPQWPKRRQDPYRVRFAELMELGDLHLSRKREAIRLRDRTEFLIAQDALKAVCECMRAWWPYEWKKFVRPHIREAMRLFLTRSQRQTPNSLYSLD